MAYVKHGKGPNDYKKGNRTRGKDRRGNRSGRPGTPEEDQRGLRAASALKADKAAHYKEVAKQQAGVIKYGQEYAGTLLDNLNEYIIDQRTQHRPLTIAGLIKASGVGYDTYYRYKNKDADHMLYQFMDDNDISYDYAGQEITLEDGRKVLLVRLSDIIKSAELAIQEQLEENCYTNKGNPVGSIFGLKAYHGWQDQPETQQTNNTLTLNVATLGEAKDALKLLSQ